MLCMYVVVLDNQRTTFDSQMSEDLHHQRGEDRDRRLDQLEVTMKQQACLIQALQLNAQNSPPGQVGNEVNRDPRSAWPVKNTEEESLGASRKRQFLEFCDETSMHGFADWKRSRLMRRFWVIVITVFFIVAFCQVVIWFQLPWQCGIFLNNSLKNESIYCICIKNM